MDGAEGVERADARHGVRLDRFAHADAADGAPREGLIAAILSDAANQNSAPIGSQLHSIAAKPRARECLCRFNRHAIYNSLILSLSKDVQRNRVARKCEAKHAGMGARR
jgi:hypothetical protein